MRASLGPVAHGLEKIKAMLKELQIMTGGLLEYHLELKKGLRN